MTSVTDPVGNVSAWQYDGLNRMNAETDPTGATTRYGYDTEDNVVTVTDALDRVTRYTYDGLNRTTSATDPLGGVTTFTYDGADNLLSETDPLHRTWTYSYDIVDRMTRATDPLGRSTAWGYDDLGNLTRFTDENGHVSTYEYDKNGRLTGATDAAGGVVRYGYDAAGNPTSETDALAYTRTAEYDANDRVVRNTDEAGRDSTYAYDPAGNLTAVTDEIGRTFARTYDAADRLVGVTDPLGGRTAYGYDLDGRLTSLTDVLGNVTRYAYDGVGRTTSVTDPGGRATRYGYDAVGNLTSVIDRDDRERQFDYDALDRMTTERWRAGGADVRVMSYTYDAADQLTSVSDPDSGYAFTYDANGRLATVDNLGTPHLPHVVLTYEHDAVGNVTQVRDSAGVRVDSEFDAKDRLTKRSWSGGGVDPVHVGLTYQARDGILSIDSFKDDPASGTSQLVVHSGMTYAPTHEMTGLTFANAAGTILASYSYAFDAAGQLTSQAENGATTTFAYDGRGQLTLAHHTDRPDEVFNWDPNGNPTGATVQPDNRVTDDGQFTYEFDGEGNRTKKTDKATGEYTTYAYDYRNRLTAVTIYSSAGTLEHASTYTYDVFDRRIGVSSDGTRTWTVYDGDAAGADYDAAGAVKARYLSGARDDELWARWQPGSGTGWYLQDRMFSVRDVTDAAGHVVDHIDYDQFGVVSETNPTAGDRFKYTGREYDPAVGLYNYRARAFDPATRTFLQQDPLGLEAGDTNLSRYAFNAPTDFRDPSGMMAVTEYAVQLGVLLGVLPTGEFKICMSESTTRLVYTASLGAADLDVEIGIVIADYGIPVPKTDQMTLCVESCADLLITAWANGVFGVTAMTLDWYNSLAAGGEVIEQAIEYAEPDEAMGLWKLRISSSCGQAKLQALADGRGPMAGPDLGFQVSLGSNTVGGGIDRNGAIGWGASDGSDGGLDEGATNPKGKPKLRVPVKKVGPGLKRGIAQRKRNKLGQFARTSKKKTRLSRKTEYPHDFDAGVKDKVIAANTDKATGKIIDPATGKAIPRSKVSIEHKFPVVRHWNRYGKNQCAAQRKTWYNNTNNLTVKPKSVNSSEGAKLGETYTQKTGPNYSRR